MRSTAPDATLDCLRMLFFVNPLPGNFVFGAAPLLRAWSGGLSIFYFARI